MSKQSVEQNLGRINTFLASDLLLGRKNTFLASGFYHEDKDIFDTGVRTVKDAILSVFSRKYGKYTLEWITSGATSTLQLVLANSIRHNVLYVSSWYKTLNEHGRFGTGFGVYCFYPTSDDIPTIFGSTSTGVQQMHRVFFFNLFDTQDINSGWGGVFTSNVLSNPRQSFTTSRTALSRIVSDVSSWLDWGDLEGSQVVSSDDDAPRRK